MANVMDYIRWRGDLTFTQDPPNAVDALVFSTLAYIRFDGHPVSHPDQPVLLREAAAEFLTLKDHAHRARMKMDVELLKAAADTVRFGACQVLHYREEYLPQEESQFGAISFLLDDGSIMIAFRGTDNSLLGWKEDFNMSFRQTVPAQRLAQEYTHQIQEEFAAPIRLCGHSKGGNLAVFAAARSSPMHQKWIKAVYNNDGPGFTEYMIGDPGYRAMVPKIRTFVPQSSIVGLLMEHEEPYTVIRSTQVSVLQHDTFSWQVMGKELIHMQEITPDSRFISETLKEWLMSMDLTERNEFVDAVYGLLTTGGVENALDIFQPANILNYLKYIRTNDAARKILNVQLMELVEAAKKAKQRLEPGKQEIDVSSLDVWP